jgi:hypothetical protein
VRESGIFLRERQQRIALGAAGGPTRMLAEEEDHKGEYEAETDREREWDNVHKMVGASRGNGVWSLEFGVGVGRGFEFGACR